MLAVVGLGVELLGCCNLLRWRRSGIEVLQQRRDVGHDPQTVFGHVLPLALPGILTGTIIGMARALGETAPLLMIGMRAFVSTPAQGVTDPTTVLPMQIFLWSDEIDQAFVRNTSAAILVLLAFLLAMNGLAIYLRNKFETRW